MSDQAIHLAFGTDSAYAPHLSVVLASIEEHCASPIVAHVLHNGVSPARRSQVELSRRTTINWIHVADDDVNPSRGWGHVSAATYLRLHLPRLLPAEIERVLYLDVDVVFCDDIRRLWGLPMGGAALAAVLDPGVDARLFAEQWRLDPPVRGYFNAGVLLLDLEQLRRSRAFEKALAMASDGRAFQYADQDILNILFWNSWNRLPERWNVQRLMLTGGALKGGSDPGALLRIKPGVVHFTMADKPWLSTGYHPYAWLYWRYLGQTPFWREIKQTNQISSALLLRRWMAFAKRWPFLKTLQKTMVN